MRPLLFALVLAAACAPSPQVVTAAEPNVLMTPQRAVRRDVPITNTFRRALAAGTRDSSGRPASKYWQQWMEYTINARLDVPTSVITGRETVVLHNNSDS